MPRRSAASRAAQLGVAQGRTSRGLSLLTPRLAPRRCNCQSRAAATGWSSFNSQLTNTSMDTKPSFHERLALMRETAEDLARAAEVVLAEAQHMEAAQKRFAARDGNRRTHKADR